MEAKWLAAVQHPNIISIRGVSSEAPHGRNFFIVLDQLHDILTTRLQIWKKQKPNGLKKMFHSGREKERDTWLERMKAAYGIASALEYLHSKNVMHRDLKPDDIGFNAKGDVMLFDFGLAKEFDPLKADKNGCYNMTPFTGSMRFMAPEVALARPCNETTDVYSYGLLLYQILALEPPFYGLTVKSFPKLVHEKGARPVVDPKWPVELSSLMKRCWSPTIRDRPSMTEVANTVSKEICLE
jgi:serine/threonine protein kinase